MSARYVVLPKADRDLDEIADYLITHADLEVGIRFLIAAQETFALLASQPEMGWKPKVSNLALASLRVFRVADFEKVLVFYRPGRARIEIVRILHGSQDLESVFEKGSFL